MNFRTDLATELRENIEGDVQGITDEEQSFDGFKLKRIKVTDKNGEKLIGRKMGTYITFELPRLSQFSNCDDDILIAIKKELQQLFPKEGTVLIVGLGNRNVTPDALGPKAADSILATRHICQQLKQSETLKNLRDTSVITPGVVGQTGIETIEIIESVVKKIKPSAVIVIDALAAKSVDRLGTTIQICDTGISPGAGVGNDRAEISKDTLGIPVIAIGVPTVVDAATLVYDVASGISVPDNLKSIVVTPSQIDLLIDRSARIISQSVNSAVHYKVDSDIILSLV